MKCLCCFLSALFITLATMSAQDADYLWKVGASRVDITPCDSVWMAGFASRTEPSAGVRMRIWAKALVLEDAGGNAGLVVTMDVLSIPKPFSDRIRRYVQDKYGLPPSQVILNSSHTHSGPVVGDALYYIYPMDETYRQVARAYEEMLVRKTRDVIDEAFASRAPARLSTGSGFARIAVNRRHNPPSPPPTLTLQGPSDYSVPVLKAERPDGTVRAVLFGYSCHATTLFDNYISGDYPGYAQQEVENLFPGAMAMFFQGCGADQNPLPRGHVSQAVQYGRQLAASVGQVLSEELKPLPSLFRACYREIPIRFDESLPRKELESMSGRDDFMGAWAKGMLGQMDRGVPFPETYPYPVVCWKLGDQVVLALGGEVSSGYSIMLKERYGQDLIVMGYCNDVMSYSPTAELWHEGGYETDDACKVYNLHARWTPELEKAIMDGIGEMMEEINKGK